MNDKTSHILVIFMLAISSCHTNTGSTPMPRTTPLPDNESANASLMTKRLIEKQKIEFPRILKELREQKGKTSHWIWWVFPTEKAGDSEPSPKTKVTLETLDDLLKTTDLDAWAQIIETIFDLLKADAIGAGTFKESGGNKPNEQIMPKADHSRIHLALVFWLQKAKESTKKHSRFFKALRDLKKFNWQ